MDIVVSNSSKVPIYEQITKQIKSMIISGKLKEGDLLPSMRGLAKSCGISIITAQKAYEDLQKDRYIETVQGKGTYVSKINNNEVSLEYENEKMKECVLKIISTIEDYNLEHQTVIKKLYEEYVEGDK